METDHPLSSINSTPLFGATGISSRSAVAGLATVEEKRPAWAERVLQKYHKWLSEQNRCDRDAVALQNISSCDDGSHSQLVNMAYREYQDLVSAGELVSINDFCSLFPPQISKLVYRQLLLFCFVDEELGSLVEELTRSEREDIHCLFSAGRRAVNDYVQGFHIQEELGRGSFARVYKATEDELGHRTVVIKVGTFGDFEAGTLGRLCHPNIVPVYSLTTDSNGISIMCMPYMGRETLREKLSELRHVSYSGLLPDIVSRSTVSETMESRMTAKSCGRLIAPHVVWKSQDSLQRGLNYGAEIASALTYAHNERVLHLDLKPSNVMVTDNDQALLFDFNLSRDALHSECRTGGTVAYMSPEQIRRVILKDETVQIDHRSDIYSLGVMLFEVFLGQLPFLISGPEQNVRQMGQLLLKQQMQYPPILMTDHVVLPSGLLILIKQCISSNPQDRPQSTGDVLRVLNRERKRIRFRRRLKGKRLFSSLGYLILAGAIGALFTFQMMQQDPVAQVTYVQEFPGSTADQTGYDGLVDQIAIEIQQHGLESAILKLQVKLDQDESPFLMELLGNLFHRLRWFSEAEKWYEHALQMDQNNIRLRTNLALCYLVNGRQAQADQVISSLVENDQTRTIELLYVHLECFLWFSRSMPVPEQQGWDIADRIQQECDLIDAPCNRRLCRVYIAMARFYSHAKGQAGNAKSAVRDYLCLALQAGATKNELLAYDELKPWREFISQTHLRAILSGEAGRSVLYIDLLQASQPTD